MGFLERMVNITKAAANEMLDRIEDPVLMLNHYLRTLDEDIAAAEQAVVQQQAQERSLKARYVELEAHTKHYEAKAEEAAASGREAEARSALEAKLLYEEQASESLRLYELNKLSAADLTSRVEALKAEKAALQTKRTELVARLHRTAGQTGPHAAGSLQGSSASRGFERIENKLMEWEAQAELRKASGSYGSPYAGSSSSSQVSSERSAQVEEQLAQLMAKRTAESV
ncbi:PspA/IM30 family protein [Paenibacillus sp. GCM10023252]|uniref:PspA/IM30 family protein n=1 Tax=Paenibacillus sp. GCM10023252 TaxID=3252649 RepID=UPI00361BC366